MRANGIRYKNRVRFGTLRCWTKNTAKDDVREKKSAMLAAGRMLFATKTFQKTIGFVRTAVKPQR